MSSVKDPLGYWRLEAKESFSDFTIVVESSKEGGGVESAELNIAGCPAKATYHVHRSHLCRGPRYSEYFRQLFKSDFQENKETCARFTFSSDMAKQFPAFLDYLYGETFVHMRRPWALAKLADYFGVESLQQESARHCAQQMFSLTKAEFDEKSQDVPSAVLVCILKKVMEIASDRERQAGASKNANIPIRMI